jgi:tetratricopeptide (TPR) repeat protein
MSSFKFALTEGLKMMEIGEIELSKTLFQKALTQASNDEDSFKCLLNIAEAGMKLQEYEEASTHLRLAQKLLPLNPEVNLLLGMCLTETKQYGEARDMLEYAVRLGETDHRISGYISACIFGLWKSNYLVLLRLPIASLKEPETRLGSVSELITDLICYKCFKGSFIPCQDHVERNHCSSCGFEMSRTDPDRRASLLMQRIVSETRIAKKTSDHSTRLCKFKDLLADEEKHLKRDSKLLLLYLTEILRNGNSLDERSFYAKRLLLDFHDHLDIESYKDALNVIAKHAYTQIPYKSVSDVFPYLIEEALIPLLQLVKIAEFAESPQKSADTWSDLLQSRSKMILSIAMKTKDFSFFDPEIADILIVKHMHTLVLQGCSLEQLHEALVDENDQLKIDERVFDEPCLDSGETLLATAVRLANHQVVRYCLHYFSSDPHKKGYRGMSALELISSLKFEDCSEKQVSHGICMKLMLNKTKDLLRGVKEIRCQRLKLMIDRRKLVNYLSVVFFEILQNFS